MKVKNETRLESYYLFKTDTCVHTDERSVVEIASPDWFDAYDASTCIVVESSHYIDEQDTYLE